MDIKEFAKYKDRKEIKEKNLHYENKITDLSKKAIKLSISQDATYWDIRQEYDQLKTSYERQQQNMLELQMKNETVISQYQEELRQRSEVLNKVECTREMCDVFEASAECLKQALLRCTSAHESLSEAHIELVQNFQEQKQSQQRNKEKHLQHISMLQEKAKMKEEHQNHKMELVKQESEAAVNKAKADLNDVKNLLANANSQLAKQEQDEKENKMKMTNYMIQFEKVKNILQGKEETLKEISDANAELKNARNNQEVVCKSLLDQKNELEERIAVLEYEKKSASQQIEKLAQDLEQAHVSDENAKKKINYLYIKDEQMRKQLKEKDDIVSSLTSETEKLKSTISAIEEEKKSSEEALKKSEEESRFTRSRVQELVFETKSLRKLVKQKKTDFNNYSLSTDLIIQELQETEVQTKEELNRKAMTVTKMRNDLDYHLNENKNMQRALHKFESQEKISENREMKLAKLEDTLIEKQNELSTLRTEMQELQYEKEQLEKKLRAIEEETGDAQTEPRNSPPPCRELADDNATMMTPTRDVRRDSPVFSPVLMFTSPIQFRQSDKEKRLKVYDMPVEDNDSFDMQMQFRSAQIKKSVRPAEYKRRRFQSPPKSAAPKQSGGLKTKQQKNNIALRRK